jgi:hypothetical protein
LIQYLVELALPLEAEGLVDPEFATEREEGGYDGDAVEVLDMDMCKTFVWRGDPPKDND